MEYEVEDGWIELRSGNKFSIYNSPEEIAKQINEKDIAHALSYLCRFNGHTKRFYTVAEHTCIMADWVAKQDWSTPVDVLTALHHDDAEYIIGDLARPIKEKIPDFKKQELKIDEGMSIKFNTIFPFPKWLKEIDTTILVDERKNVMGKSNNVWATDHLSPLGVKFMPIKGLFPFLIRREWLKRHYKYSSLI